VKRLLLLAITLAAFAAPAEAKPWTVDYAQSHIGFGGTANGSAFTGAFKSFTAAIDFDPDHPETGKISATIDIGGAATGDRQRDAMLPQADWFDAAKFPEAQFTSTAIRKTGADSFEAAGTLTIKGIAHPVTLPFTLVKEGDHWRAQGKADLLRNDFHIGEGDWNNQDYVKYAVAVTVDIAAQPAS